MRRKPISKELLVVSGIVLPIWLYSFLEVAFSKVSALLTTVVILWLFELIPLAADE